MVVINTLFGAVLLHLVTETGAKNEFTKTMTCGFEHSENIVDIKWYKHLEDDSESCLTSISRFGNWSLCHGVTSAAARGLTPEKTFNETRLHFKSVSEEDEGIYKARLGYRDRHEKTCTFHLLETGAVTLLPQRAEVLHIQAGTVAFMNFSSRAGQNFNLLNFQLFNRTNASMVQCGQRSCEGSNRITAHVSNSAVVVKLNAVTPSDTGLYWFHTALADRLPETGWRYLRVFQNRGHKRAMTTDKPHKEDIHLTSSTRKGFSQVGSYAMFILASIMGLALRTDY